MPEFVTLKRGMRYDIDMNGDSMFSVATRVRCLLIFAVAAVVVFGFGSTADAQSPPSWPTMKPTAAPSPSPTALPSATPSPSPTPQPSPTPDADPSSTPPPAPPEGPEDPIEADEDRESEKPDNLEESDEPGEPEEPQGTSQTDEGHEPEEAGNPEEADEPGETEGTGQPEEEAEDPPESEQKTNPGDLAFTDYQPFDLDEIEYEPGKTKWKRFVQGFRGIARYNLFNGNLKFRLGARGQVDGTVGKGGEKYEEFYLPIENDFSVRRFEVYAIGRVKKFNFNFAFEFGPDWGVNDAWIEGAEGGLEVWGRYLGKLRVGWLNEPFSLQRQTSAYNLGFLERSLPVQTIAPGSNIGSMVHDSGPKGRFSWAVGIFSVGQSNDGNASASSLSLTGRITHLLWHRNDGRTLLHVGLSLSSRSPTGGDTRYRSRPEARFVDYLIDTGNIDASHITLVGLEVAGVHGPVWIAAEHIRSQVSAQLVGDPTFKGSYVQVGWFLTGDSRRYRANSGTFARHLPLIKYGGGNPFKKKNGGTWEVVGRLSRVDLTDG
jgi:phosphate-selective porin